MLATTAIEGNTLSEEEVLLHFKGKLKLPPSHEYLSREIDNVLEACNLISREVIRNCSESNAPEKIRKYNCIILDGLPLAEDVVHGEVRSYSVAVGHYRGVPPKHYMAELHLFEFHQP